MQLKAPITYNIYDGDKLVFKTKSATKASDYRVTNGKHLSIMATDSIGNTKKLYADGGGVDSEWTVTIVYPSDNKRSGWSSDEVVDINVLANSHQSAEQKAMDKFKKTHSGKKGRVTSVNSNTHKFLDNAKLSKGSTIKNVKDDRLKAIERMLKQMLKAGNFISILKLDSTTMLVEYRGSMSNVPEWFIDEMMLKYNSKRMAKGSTIEGGEYRSYINNIYRNQSEQSAREGLMNFASEQGFEISDVENALQVYKYDTEENAWGENYYTKKAIAKMVDMISGKYANGGGVETESTLRKRFEGYTDEELQIYNGDNAETLKNWNRKDAIQEAIDAVNEEGEEEERFTYKDIYTSQGGMTFETEEEVKKFIKRTKPFIRKQLKEGNFVVVFNGKEYYIAEKIKHNEYGNGGGVGILEQRIALAKKKSKVAKDGKYFGSEVYLVLQHKTDPEEIFVISQFNYNNDRHNNQWNDYNIVFKTNEYADGGGVGIELDYWKIKNVDKENNIYYTYLQKNVASPIPFDSVEITKEQYEKARKGFDYSIGGL
jgi:hypothetical protein